MKLPSREALQQALGVVYAAMLPTPQIRWPQLCARLGTEVWVKHENHTPLGSFKIRGGLVYFDELRKRNPATTGVIAATRGNHGQSIAFAARRHGYTPTVVVPHGNSREKNAAMRALGAKLIEHGSDFQDAFDHAQQLAAQQGLHMVPSFDEALVRGVASYSWELFHAVQDLHTLYVPIGWGSGICGAMAVRDALGLKTEIVGVVAASAPAYLESFVARRAMPRPITPTIADGVAIRTAFPDALEAILRGVARVVSVEEHEIRAAMRHLFTDTHNLAEGAGATALAAAEKERSRMQGKRIGIVLSGCNVDREVFAAVLADDRGEMHSCE